MAFDTRNGSRGARQPGGRLLGFMNRLMIGRVRRGGGGNLIVLTTLGRKSGEERQSPVAGFPLDDGAWLVVASANGAPKNPAWYYNIGAHPDRIRIENRGRTVPVSAEQLHGADLEAAWQTIVAAQPRFGDYRTKTDREIPVIRLTPRAA
ncbi:MULTISPECIES: nitroreductase/quinone reductase family protein [Actinoplanes]|uniref:nitroreductase/quinone reductase family protein n=1 Tax=Actinoplanes TaxID=1865 RepID=UPI0005F28780|nr:MULTISPECIES: nitroreductase/quinone reductase family protein [Actinoplanes]